MGVRRWGWAVGRGRRVESLEGGVEGRGRRVERLDGSMMCWGEGCEGWVGWGGWLRGRWGGIERSYVAVVLVMVVVVVVVR